jgi:phytanoyl-CoA hydroxylase
MSNLTTLLTKEQIEQYREEGYLLVKGLFDAEKLTAIDQWLNEIASRRNEFPQGKFVMEKLSDEKMKKLSPLGAVRKINSLATDEGALEFFGPNSQASRMCAELTNCNDQLLIFLSAFAKPALHGSSTPWHQDQALWNFYCPNFLSCWVALDPCTKENGYLQFYRGGHKEGMIPHTVHEGAPHLYIPEQLLDKSRIVAVPMDAGDAVFFGGVIPHFSEPNRSPHRRVGIPAVYGSEAELKQAVNLARWVRMRETHKLNYLVDEKFLNSRDRMSPH